MSSHDTETECTAFRGDEIVAHGRLPRVAALVKGLVDMEPNTPILIFDNATSKLVDVDFRGTSNDVLLRLSPTPAPETTGPGRPKLGVVPREVTLLPRHWEWLNEQPGGASVTLRKLVEEARKANEGKDRKRKAQEATGRFMSAMAGDRAGYEEASRALYAGDRERFERMIEGWPADVRKHTQMLSAIAFETEGVPA